MADLRRTPSLQHAVALIGSSVDVTLQNMRELEAARIKVTLNPGRRLIKPLMEGRSLKWALRQLDSEKDFNKKPNIDLISAFDPFAKNKSVKWFRNCPTQHYPIGSGVIIPVRPSGFWSEAGNLSVLWTQCWKGRTLDDLQKAIFSTIIKRAFFVGDFRDAHLHWVDLREKEKKAGRTIEVSGWNDLGDIEENELIRYMTNLLEAFRIFDEERRRSRAKERASRHTSLPLFDGDHI